MLFGGVQPSGCEILAQICFLPGREHQASVLHGYVFRTVILQFIVAAAIAVHLNVPVIGVESRTVEIIGPDKAVAIHLAASFLTGRSFHGGFVICGIVNYQVRRLRRYRALARHREKNRQKGCGKRFFHRKKGKAGPASEGRAGLEKNLLFVNKYCVQVDLLAGFSAGEAPEHIRVSAVFAEVDTHVGELNFILVPFFGVELAAVVDGVDRCVGHTSIIKSAFTNCELVLSAAITEAKDLSLSGCALVTNVQIVLAGVCSKPCPLYCSPASLRRTSQW